MSPTQPTRTRQHGLAPLAALRPAFTLLEVMIVVVIILAIAGLVTVNLMSARDRATTGTVQAQLKSLKDALKQFNLEYNRYPTDDEGLAVLWDKAKLSADADQTKWRKFLDEALPNDTWATPWNYQQVGEKAPEGMFDLSSSGPDKQPGTEDDLNAWPKSSMGEGSESDGPDGSRPSDSGSPSSNTPSGGSRPSGG